MHQILTSLTTSSQPTCPSCGTAAPSDWRNAPGVGLNRRPDDVVRSGRLVCGQCGQTYAVSEHADGTIISRSARA